MYVCVSVLLCSIVSVLLWAKLPGNKHDDNDDDDDDDDDGGDDTDP